MGSNLDSDKENGMRTGKKVLGSVLHPLREFLVCCLLVNQGTYLLGFIRILGGDLVLPTLQLLLFRLELIVLRSGSPREEEGGAG